MSHHPSPLEICKKQKAALRYHLLGRAAENHDWYRAIEAMQFADIKHTGQLRKDGITPYFAHPVDVALYVLTLPNLIKPIETVITALNHDVLEDTATRYQEMADELGYESADGVASVSKKIDGVKKGVEEYRRGAYRNMLGTLVKPADRVSNTNSMGGVFTFEKMGTVIAETEEWIIPLAKHGRQTYPQQTLAYENLKLVLKAQTSLYHGTVHAMEQARLQLAAA